MKLRVTFTIEVPDAAVFKAYDPVFHRDIREREAVQIGQIALDCVHARCSGGSQALRDRIVYVHTEEITE
jgi:hypothetical protein